MKKVIRTILLLSFIRRIHKAYIDPNTGGLIFQMLAVLFGLLSGALLFFSSRIRMGLARLQRYIRERRGDPGDEQMQESSELPN
ncbi:MAG: hypothetical protein ACOC9C_02360 [Chloroflexota bacterium]